MKEISKKCITVMTITCIAGIGCGITWVNPILIVFGGLGFISGLYLKVKIAKGML